MRLHELKAASGATKNRKRRGRGTATGQGKTSGRGMNGQKSRSGGGVRLGFEGGQMPLYRRIPKRGFTNIFGTVYSEVNVGSLERFEEGQVIDSTLLIQSGIIKKELDGVKILGNGEITKAFTVKAAKFSKAAKEKIEKAGGKIEEI